MISSELIITASNPAFKNWMQEMVQDEVDNDNCVRTEEYSEWVESLNQPLKKYGAQIVQCSSRFGYPTLNIQFDTAAQRTVFLLMYS